jgi:hypothetical protein
VPNNAAVLLQHGPGFNQGDELAVPKRQRDLRSNSVGRRARIARTLSTMACWSGVSSPVAATSCADATGKWTPTRPNTPSIRPRPCAQRRAMASAYTAKTKRFISARTRLNGSVYRRGARKDRPFCRGAISGKYPSAGFTVPRRVGQRPGSGSRWRRRFAANVPGPPS